VSLSLGHSDTWQQLFPRESHKRLKEEAAGLGDSVLTQLFVPGLSTAAAEQGEQREPPPLLRGTNSDPPRSHA